MNSPLNKRLIDFSDGIDCNKTANQDNLVFTIKLSLYLFVFSYLQNSHVLKNEGTRNTQNLASKNNYKARYEISK